MISENTSLSTRKAASAIGVSSYLIISILHDDARLKPYRTQEWHKLETRDYERRVNFATWLPSLHRSVGFYLLCCNEAYFYLTPSMNKQNAINWLPERPTNGIETPLYDQKVLV